MPKKLHTNPKAEEARARKENVKQERRQTEEKKALDSVWADEGCSASERRAAEREQKRVEEQKKKEQKRLAQLRDEAEMKSVKTARVNPHKVTLANIAAASQQQQEKADKEREEQERAKNKVIVPEPSLPVNVNQVERDRQLAEREQYGEGGVISARSLTEAVAALSVSSLSSSSSSSSPSSVPVDRHPEKRVKAAYKTYEDTHWEELKQANPGLKFSQLKELMFKQWQKAPENPLNQQREEE